MIATQYHIRWMIRSDMHQVIDIERGSFPTPWTENDFITRLRMKGVIGLVATADYPPGPYGAPPLERVVGYMVYELHTNRYHVINFAVCETMRWRGVGSALAARLKQKLGGDRNRILLEVGERNLPGQLFWKSQGFRCENIISDFFDESDDKAYQFVYRRQG
jgi:ribosomal-protein-alanine N-acetyltransferase